MTSFSALLICLVGALIGSMFFFAIVVAPTVFKSLPAEYAGTFLRALFPHYYLWGLIIALVIALLAINTYPLVSVACSLVAMLFVYSRQILMPKINKLRDAQLQGDTGAGRHFKQLHRWSVLINAGQVLVLLVIAVTMIADI